MTDDRLMILAPDIDFHAVSDSGAEVWSIQLDSGFADDVESIGHINGLFRVDPLADSVTTRLLTGLANLSKFLPIELKFMLTALSMLFISVHS
jgi:hypothetical protein